jgi:hypothetical protein
LSKLNIHPHEAFQVNPTVARLLAKRKRRIARRLRRSRHRQDTGWADLPVGKVTYEVSDRVNAVAHGGLGLVHQLVSELGVARGWDS